MPGKSILCILTFLALAAGQSTLAQAANLDLKSMLRPPVVGAWSSYAVIVKGEDKPRRFRVSAVGREQFEGAPHLWLELTVIGNDGDSLTAMGLFPAGEFLGLKAKKVVLKLGKSEAQEVPAGLASLGTMLATRFGLGLDLDDLTASIREGAQNGISATEQAPERLDLKQGALDTRRLLVQDPKGREVTIWLSDRAPLFGFAQAVHEARRLELTAWGASGAVSRIGSRYHPFNLQGMFDRMLGK
ncbi:hypothetical protein LLH00_13175 [bacterium]|nr:hypothetical protein [bacterium]